jgi:outer membrane protein assembly factor BamB
MTRPVLRTFACAGVLTLGVAACSGGEQGGEEQAFGVRTAPPKEAESPPPAPQLTIRVVDGDTRKPVRGALVSVQGQRVRTDAKGLAGMPYERTRAMVRVTAPRYGPRTVRVRYTPGLAERVKIWRPAMQWPIYGVNPARTQVHPGIKLRPPFRVVWKHDLGSLLEFPAVVWNGVAYINNIRGVLRAFSMGSGQLLWKRRVGTLMASSPAVVPERGILVVTTMSPGNVSVVSMKTGRVLWRYPVGRSEPSPVVRDGVAYLATAGGTVYALDLERRRPRWTFRGGAKITSSATLVGNRLYIGDYAGRVFALDARTGRRIWTGSAGTRVYGTVAAARGRIFAPSVFSGLSALSARTGRLLWRIPSGAYLYSSPAVYRGRVYFGTYAGRVYCASASSGRILWSRAAGGRVSGAIVVIAGLVYAGSLEDKITAWHWRTGRRRWSFPRGQYVPVSGNSSRLLFYGARKIWAMAPKRRG